MKKTAINAFMSLVILLVPHLAQAAEWKIYDFQKECGFYFASPFEFFASSYYIGDIKICAAYRHVDDDFVIDDNISSLDKLFSAVTGNFSPDEKGKIHNMRQNHVGGKFYGDIASTILKKKEVIALKKRSRDKIMVFLIKFGREDPICLGSDDQECWKRAENSKWIEKNYECWDGVFFGKNGISGVAVDGLCSPLKPGDSFASLNSWQAKLIKSLVITIGEDASYPSPSFDCAEASSSIEKTICANARLSLLDATLDSNYKRLKSANPDDKSEQLLADQRAWIKQRNACKTPECLTKVYSQRIDELCAKYPAASGKSPDCTLVKDIEFAP